MAMAPATATPTGTSRKAEVTVAARALTSLLTVADFASRKQTSWGNGRLRQAGGASQIMLRLEPVAGHAGTVTGFGLS
jgi:hypothetical protein